MTIHKNIDWLFPKRDIPEIKKQLDEEIPKILNELDFKTTEPLKITYEIVSYPKGYCCAGKLYLGERLVKEYDDIDFLFYELFHFDGCLAFKNTYKEKDN